MPTIYNRDNFELELGFTKIYQENSKVHRAVREARCLKWQLPRILLDIEEDDLVPGGCHYGAVGFSSQIGGFLYYYHEEKILDEIEKNREKTQYVTQLKEMLDFWKKENSKDGLRALYGEREKLALPTDNWENEKAVTYPLYRIAGAILDFDKLLKLGLPGLKQKVEDCLARSEECSEEHEVYCGMQIALSVLEDVIKCYRDRALQKKEEAENEGKQQISCRMGKIAETLATILIQKPVHLLEAVELFWMYVLVSEVRNYGRIDDYLGDFYAHDIDNGFFAEEQADEIICKLWERMGKRRTITDGRIFIGGRGRKNEKNADRLAKSCVKATRKLRNPDPQLSLRFYKGMDEQLIELGYEAIGEGCTYPILYNDDVIIDDVMQAFEVSKKEAVDYVPYGCGEYILAHKSFGTPSGVLNLLKGLEIFMRFGRTQDAEYLKDNKAEDILNKIKEYTGVGKPFEQYDSFDEFYSDFKKWIAFHIEIAAWQEKLEYDYTGKICALPFLSMLYDDCIERGKAIFDGGIHYLGGTLESYGNVNTADSLYAIKKLVFEDKVIEKGELIQAVMHDFDGYELVQKRLRLCSKFGNDEQEPDRIMSDLHRFVCITAKSQAEKNGLHSYLVVVINNSANTSLGLLTQASPDGRNAKKPMANANSPQAGGDKNGVTAVLNSMLKVDTKIHAGAVQNIKFAKETFMEHRSAVRRVMDAYFEQGGAQLMVTVVGREDLENALIYPKKYANLLVRVGGFSARFVELSPEVQSDILSRTCY